jgi:hypothetical protein
LGEALTTATGYNSVENGPNGVWKRYDLPLAPYRIDRLKKGDAAMKLNPKFSGILMSLMIAFVMSLVMSFVMVVVNLGFTDEFFITWLCAWLTSLSVGFPTAAIIVPFARRLAIYLISDSPN